MKLHAIIDKVLSVFYGVDIPTHDRAMLEAEIKVHEAAIANAHKYPAITITEGPVCGRCGAKVTDVICGTCGYGSTS